MCVCVLKTQALTVISPRCWSTQSRVRITNALMTSPNAKKKKTKKKQKNNEKKPVKQSFPQLILVHSSHCFYLIPSRMVALSQWHYSERTQISLNYFCS